VLNGTRNGNGNGKRWLLIALVVLGAFWLVNDAYRDGYYDAMVQTGQISRMHEYDGPHFPWGLLIIGGIAYIAWRKGVFDRFSGPGGGSGANMGFGGPAIRSPRQIFDEWHREAHAAQRSAPPAPASSFVTQVPVTPPAPAAPPAAASSGNGMPAAAPSTPAPTPPAPDYWSTMAQSPAAGAGPDATATGTAVAPPQAPPADQSGRDGGTSGPALERW
jgi:hypothetical protein